jgi:hypothetical protein
MSRTEAAADVDPVAVADVDPAVAAGATAAVVDGMIVVVTAAETVAIIAPVAPEEGINSSPARLSRATSMQRL